MLVCRSAKDVSRGNDLPCVVVGSETRAGMGLPLNVARRLALDRALRREVENISKEQVADYSSRLEIEHRIGQFRTRLASKFLKASPSSWSMLLKALFGPLPDQ